MKASPGRYGTRVSKGAPLTSEEAVLARINDFFPNSWLNGDPGNSLILGRGDDCAIIASREQICVSTDLFMEDVHFRRSYFSPQDIGWKSLAVNVSDLAACGARPLGFTVGLSLPFDADMDLVDGLCTGMAELAGQVGIPLIGGDLSRAERLHVCITVLGQTACPLRRGRAIPGDIVFLVGEIGLARLGLQILERYGATDLDACRHDWPVACAAHLHPFPRLAEGQALAALARSWEENSKTSRIGLMDLSDGLARDLPRLLGHWGARIELPEPHPELLRFVRSIDTANPEQLARQEALLGGEDYGLIGTCPPERLCALQAAVPSARVIGTVTADTILKVDGMPVSGGFDHFA